MTGQKELGRAVEAITSLCARAEQDERARILEAIRVEIARSLLSQEHKHAVELIIVRVFGAETRGY